jgi:hypothetical protein
MKSAVKNEALYRECDSGNRAAVALLRRCQFEAAGGDRYQINRRFA